MRTVGMERCGLLVDLDGTIADSLGVLRRTYHRLLQQHGKTGSDAEFDRLNGPPLTQVVASLIARHDLDITRDALLLDYRAAVTEEYRQVQPIRGAEHLLTTAQELGLAVSVVTSNNRELASSWLEAVGLDEHVDVIVGEDDVTHGKPDPEPYLRALADTRSSAATSFALEDSPTGASAAIAAGIPTFLLRRPATPRSEQDILPAGLTACVGDLIEATEHIAAACRDAHDAEVGAS